jgi:hypothetical protein
MGANWKGWQGEHVEQGACSQYTERLEVRIQNKKTWMVASEQRKVYLKNMLFEQKKWNYGILWKIKPMMQHDLKTQNIILLLTHIKWIYRDVHLRPYRI